MDLPLDTYISFFYEPIRPFTTMKPKEKPQFTMTANKIMKYRCWAYTMKHHYEHLTNIYYSTEEFVAEMQRLGYVCDSGNNFYLKINKNLDDNHYHRLRDIFYKRSSQLAFP